MSAGTKIVKYVHTEIVSCGNSSAVLGWVALAGSGCSVTSRAKPGPAERAAGSPYPAAAQQLLCCSIETSYENNFVEVICAPTTQPVPLPEHPDLQTSFHNLCQSRVS